MSTVVPRLAAILALGAIALALVLVIARGNTTGSDSQVASEAPAPTATPVGPTPTPEPIPVLGEALDLVELDGWLNTDLASFDEIRAENAVTVVQFWTFGCYNCKNTLPHMQDLYETYGDEGLEIIGVHAPEFSYEADPTNVADALVDLGVTWPVALDTEKRNFRAWQSGGRRFWPRIYILDAEGNIRFDHIGEGKYDDIERTVAQLLDEA